MLHTLSAPLHPSKARRAVSMPALSLTSPGPYLPAPSTASSSSSSSRRRVSASPSLASLAHLAKLRASLYAVPLSLAGLCVLAFLYLVVPAAHGAHSPYAASAFARDAAGIGSENASRLRWYRRAVRGLYAGDGYAADGGGGGGTLGHPDGFEREQSYGAFSAAAPSARARPPADAAAASSAYAASSADARVPPRGGAADNGLSLLVSSEDELIAEDDLFWESYTEVAPASPEEEAAEREQQARRLDVMERDRAHSLRALVYWMAEGGVIPPDYEVPSKQVLRKIGGRGVERLLEDLAGGPGTVFESGWADFAKGRYREVVFSKTYCPYSKNAKAILETYHLSPTPFIIELDQRSDTQQVQTLLFNLTGRRTVPNILLDFRSIGGSDDLTLLHSEGGLQRMFDDMGVARRVRRRGGTAADALRV